MLALAFLTATAALVAFPAPGADALEPGAVDTYGVWSNALGIDSGTPPCLVYLPAPQSTTPGSLNQVRFGKPLDGSGCSPAGVGQSGFGFTGVAGGTVVTGDYFEIGRLTHYNNPIKSSDSKVGTADLTATVKFAAAASALTLAFEVGLDETPNEANPCAYPAGPNDNGCSDRITVSSPASQQVTVGDTTFTVEVIGFTSVSDGSCQTTGGSLEFLTAEAATTSACLMGRITPGSLTIIKNTTGGDAEFDFTLTEFGEEPEDIAVATDGGTGTTGVMSIAAGSYTLSEAAEDGWVFESLLCYEGDTKLETDGATVKLDVDSDDSITCTFSNSYSPPPSPGRVKIIKLADHEEANSDENPFGLMLNSTLVAPDTWVEFDGGTEVTASEEGLEGWYQVGGARCGPVQDQIEVRLVDVYLPSPTVVVEAGTDYVCEIENRQYAKVTVTKEANASGSFSFTLWEDGEGWTERDSAILARGDSQTWYVEGGTSYGLTEGPLPAYWSLADVECTGEYWEGQVDDGQAWFWVGGGGEVSCTFTNHYNPPVSTTTTTVPVTPILDLQIDKTGEVTQGIEEVGDVAEVEWILVISHGPGSNTNAVGATISDPAPSGMTFTAVSSADLTCAIVANAVECGPFDLALGASATVVVTASVDSAGTFDNVATVEVPGDVFRSNNTDEASVGVTEVLPLEVLPETGADTVRLAWAALTLLLMGGALVAGSRFRLREHLGAARLDR